MRLAKIKNAEHAIEMIERFARDKQWKTDGLAMYRGWFNEGKICKDVLADYEKFAAKQLARADAHIEQAIAFLNNR